MGVSPEQIFNFPHSPGISIHIIASGNIIADTVNKSPQPISPLFTRPTCT
ncbi:MAG: hypothetical protein WC586_02755 [Methanoregula sp.]